MFAHELQRHPDLWREFGRAAREKVRREAPPTPRTPAAPAAAQPLPASAELDEAEPTAAAEQEEPKGETAPPAPTDAAQEQASPGGEAAQSGSPASEAPRTLSPAERKVHPSPVHVFKAVGTEGWHAADAVQAAIAGQGGPTRAAGAGGGAGVHAFSRPSGPTYGPPPPFPLDWLRRHPDFQRMGVRGSFDCGCSR
ncbi:MAG TPA: hypothetical protein VF234_01900 [Limnochordia bacterium]